MSESFTWFAKIGAICERLSEEDRRSFVDAVACYGMWGKEPDLAYPLDLVFISIKEDIDNSKEARAVGGRGGRPKKTPSKTPVKTPVKTPLKTPVSENEKPGVKTPVKTQSNTSQANTYQSNTGQGGAHPAPFSPPTREEVEAYAKAEGLDVDAARFVDHYAANGWKVGGHAPMNDWKAAARNWSRRESERPRASASTPKERNLDGYVFDF